MTMDTSLDAENTNFADSITVFKEHATLPRISIIYPPITKQERYSSALGASGGRQIPLGIFYLGAHLRNNGYSVQVIDAEALELSSSEVVDRVTEFGADLVGISSTTVALHRAGNLAKSFRQKSPNIPIVLGGPHVSACPKDSLKNEFFDIGVVGEGEVTFLELVRTMGDRKPLSQVDGIVFRHDGKVIATRPRESIMDLDSLAFPAYDLIPDLAKYYPPPCNYKRIPVVNIITSRGCPNQCTFCDRNVFGQKLRQRGAGNVAEEIIMLHKDYGVKEIAFVDDTFTIGKRRIRKIFELLDRAGVQIFWTCLSRVDTVDYELLQFMKDHGCWHISFGIESGNEALLRGIRKNIDLGQVKKVVHWCASLHIKSKGFFIVGHPGETEKTIDQTIRFALELPLDDVVVTLNTPIPGSIQYDEAKLYGTLDDTDWRAFNCWRPVFVPAGLSANILQAKHKEFYRRFYLRPRIIMRYILSLFSAAGPQRLLAVVRSAQYLLPNASTHRSDFNQKDFKLKNDIK